MPSRLQIRLRDLADARRRFDPVDTMRRIRWLLTGARGRMIPLDPERPSGRRALFSFIIEPFLQGPGRVSHAHTHDWESLQMVRTLLDAGYGVDVIRWSNRGFLPARDYDLFIDPRLNLERLAPGLPAGCLKVMHIETAHPGVHNAAQLRRLRELRERRGIELAPFKLIEENRAIEHADRATCLGNEFTMASYAFAGKPIRRIPISAPFLYPCPEKRFDAACRHSWIWFGSEGFVHKGLDLALDAFAGLPGFTLYVCGPLWREPDFRRAYYRELHRAPNIRAVGWVDVSGRRFSDLARRCLGLIYPSCSEGGAGSALTCMHAGLIPLVPREASLDLDPAYGRLLPDCRVETLRNEVQRLAETPEAALAGMSQNAWAFARANHTRERFARAWREAVEEFASG